MYMKKIKKWIVPLLVMLLVPLTLAGCSFGKTTPQKSLSDGQLWYVVKGKGNNPYVSDVISTQKGKLIIADMTPKTSTYLRFNDFKNAKTMDDIKKILSKHSSDIETSYLSKSAKYYIFTNNGNTDKEAILSSESNEIVLSSTKVSLENGKLNGFKVDSDADANINSDSEYFVTNSKKVELDTSKNKNVVVQSINDESQILDSNSGYNG